MIDFDRINLMVKENSDECFAGSGANLEIIKEFEKAMGVSFPQSYVEFLKIFGTLIFVGEEFYGITPKGLNSKSAPCVFFITKKLQSRGDASHNMVVVGVSGDGSSFCIDYDVEGDDGEPAIVEVGLDYKRTKNKKLISNSFGEFLETKMKEALD